MTVASDAFGVVSHFGESPVWDRRTDELLWVDVEDGLVWAARDDLPARVILDAGEMVTAIAPAGADRPVDDYFLVVEHEVALWNRTTGDRRTLAGLPVDANEPRPTRFNDGAVDPAGRFWVGSMAADHGPGLGRLFVIDASPNEPTFEEVLTGIGISNGIDWSSDGNRMFYVDSLTRRVDVFDYDVITGTATNRREFADLGDVAGYPDGLTVDADDRVWVAMWDGGAVRCHSAEGELVHHIDLPVSSPTSVAAGGPYGNTLYVTTSRAGRSPAELNEQPLAGTLLKVDIPR